MTTFEWLNPKDQVQVDKLRTFAASFDHKIESLAHPIYIVKRGDVWIGYAQIVHLPVVFTAWNPKTAKARGIWEAMLQFVGWAKLQFGAGFTTVPLDTKTFLPEVMKKLGFRKMGLEIYEPNKE